jgi:hypothetical protein
MKKYREKIGPATFFVYSVHKDRFVHDFVKGWGRISPSGKTVLWESWSRPKKSKRLSIKKSIENFKTFVMPVIGSAFADAAALSDIISVQPMQLPGDKTYYIDKTPDA